MEELSGGGGSRRPLRGADEREEKVAAAEILGRTKKRENRYEKAEDICFSEEDICFFEEDICFLRKKIFFAEKNIFPRMEEKERGQAIKGEFFLKKKKGKRGRERKNKRREEVRKKGGKLIEKAERVSYEGVIASS